MNGDELRRALSEAGLSYRQFADEMGTTTRTITNWLASRVPEARLGRVELVLARHQGRPGATAMVAADDPLREASDLALIAELTRRLVERQKEGGSDVGKPGQKIGQASTGHGDNDELSQADDDESLSDPAGSSSDAEYDRPQATSGVAIHKRRRRDRQQGDNQ